MSEIVGHVDLRSRPLVNIWIPGRDDAILALVDTGFNGNLLMHESVVQQLGFVRTGTIRNVALVTHVVRRLPIANGHILWFGNVREIPVLVGTDELPSTMPADEPMALLGTALLSRHKLLIDFSTRRAVIAQAQ